MRDTEAPPPPAPEELLDTTDSLLTFPSEQTSSEESYSVRPASITQPTRPYAGHRVPVAIIDDRATREAIARLAVYSDTLAKLQSLCASIDERLERAERTSARLGDAEQELRRHIGERLEQTEETVRRTEGAIAAYVDRSREELAALHARYADIDRRLSQAEESFRRPPAIEAPLPARLVLPEWRRVMKPLLAVGALVVVSILFMMRSPVTGGSQPVARLIDRELQLRNSLVEAPALSAPATAPVLPLPLPRPAAPARRAAVTSPTDEVAPRPFVGDLSIVSRPSGARVFINGRAVGVTPLVLYERQAGSVAVQIAGEGFERWSASVQVRAGQMTNVSATLRPARP